MVGIQHTHTQATLYATTYCRTCCQRQGFPVGGYIETRPHVQACGTGAWPSAAVPVVHVHGTRAKRAAAAAAAVLQVEPLAGAQRKARGVE